MLSKASGSSSDEIWWARSEIWWARARAENCRLVIRATLHGSLVHTAALVEKIEEKKGKNMGKKTGKKHRTGLLCTQLPCPLSNNFQLEAKVGVALGPGAQILI